MLHAAGADAAVVNRTESTGDPARPDFLQDSFLPFCKIRLPPSPPDEFTVIEYEVTALLSLSLSFIIALPYTSSVWEASTANTEGHHCRGES